MLQTIVIIPRYQFNKLCLNIQDQLKIDRNEYKHETWCKQNINLYGMFR